MAAATVLALAVGRWTTADAERPSHRHATIPSEVRGRALVLDGDTIDIRGVRIRLFGMDAPERDQTCQRGDGSRYACGSFAREALATAIGNSDVSCTRRDVDKYGRMVGVCRTTAENRADGTSKDLAELMVARGAAIAYRHYSRDYVDEEERAHAAREGVWQGAFEAPWDYRSRKRR